MAEAEAFEEEAKRLGIRANAKSSVIIEQIIALGDGATAAPPTPPKPPRLTPGGGAGLLITLAHDFT